MKLKNLIKELHSLGNQQKAVFAQRFFKTGPGEYGENDKFIGITVPEVRQIAKKYSELNEEETLALLHSPIHEERLLALTILTYQFPKGDEKTKEKIYKLYLKNTKYINNWDLVDTSADKIIGPFLENKDREILTKLATSKSLWERRIAMISTFYYIKKGDPSETYKIAEILITDKHDLIQKALGWMLRETGKRCSQKSEEDFLKKHYKTMGRTALRYAIERFEPDLRIKYLKGTI